MEFNNDDPVKNYQARYFKNLGYSDQDILGILGDLPGTDTGGGVTSVSAKEMSHKLDTLAPRESIRVITDATDRVCGWGIVKMYSERPGYRLTCETSLFIDSQFRGKGLGKKMQLALHTTAQELGFHHIIVRIWAANETSIALHKTCGFSLVGIQKEIGHVDQKWIDVAVMQCLLN